MRCAYVRHLWDCGESLEIEEKHTGRYGARGQKREKRKKASPEDIKRQNKWKRERDLRRLIKWNFGKYDYWMTITYRKGDRPAWEQMNMDTIRRYLSSFFAWISDEGYISRNPMRRLKKIKVPRMIKKPFTQAEMEHLRCNAECQRDIAIMAFLYSTAARIGEVVRLNRKDIDWGNKEVIIYGEKGKKERRVYLTDDCAYHLHKYLLSRDDTNPALFVSNKKPHTRLGKQAIQSMLRTLGQKTEIHAHPHKFRRTLLTDAGNRGIPLQEIQMYAGHQKPDTTMMYVTVSEENVRASFRRYIA